MRSDSSESQIYALRLILLLDDAFKYFRFRAQQRYWSLFGDNISIPRFVDWRDMVTVPLNLEHCIWDFESNTIYAHCFTGVKRNQTLVNISLSYFCDRIIWRWIVDWRNMQTIRGAWFFYIERKSSLSNFTLLYSEEAWELLWYNVGGKRTFSTILLSYVLVQSWGIWMRNLINQLHFKSCLTSYYFTFKLSFKWLNLLQSACGSIIAIFLPLSQGGKVGDYTWNLRNLNTYL